MKKNFTKLFSVGLLCLSLHAFGQQKPITGKVLDSSGFPVQDAYVYVEGAEDGVYTDENGIYTIEAKPGDVVSVEFIGFDTKKIIVNEKNSDYTVKLSGGNLVSLDPVMQVGYRQLSQNDQTGSVTQIRSEDLNKVPLTSVDQALQGKVAGLNITGSSGAPGSVQNIMIRGRNSINSGTNPLYVIDGVPVVDQNEFDEDDTRTSFSPLALFNSNDIESITVLKDASATAAYGARGANGVILITTKSGKSGKTKFSFASRLGVQRLATGLPKVLNAEQRFKLFNQMLDGLNLTDSERQKRINDTYGTWLKEGRPSTDWASLIQKKAALLQDYNLSASGSDKNSSFYASLGYNFTEGVVIGTDFERVTAKLNYNRNLSDKLTLSTNNIFSNGKQKGIEEQGGYFANPIMTPYFISPTKRAYNADGSINTSIAPLYNPLYIAKEDFDNRELTRFLSNNSLKYKFNDRFSFKTVASFDYLVDAHHYYANPVYGEGEARGGIIDQGLFRNFTWSVQNIIEYSKTLGDNHNLNLSLVQEYQKNKINELQGSGKKIPEPGRIYLETASSELKTTSTFKDNAHLSYLFLANYNFAKKYVLDATFRREADSRFAKGHRFGNFYSLGVAWNIHNENFIRNIKQINNLKLRASYGLTGNSNIDRNLFLNALALDVDYNGAPASYPKQYGNEHLTWEKTNSLDFGLDFGLFNNRISGQVTYFNKETKDMLTKYPISPTSGYDEKWINNGVISNKGFEVELTGKIIDTKDYGLELSANIATVDNKVKSLAVDSNGDVLKTVTNTRIIDEGLPIYSWFLPVWAGVNPNNGNPTWYVDPKNKPGVITENYNEAQQSLIGGSALPKYTGGFSANVRVKNFFASASLYFSGGNKVYENSFVHYTYANNLRSVALYNGLEDLLNSWTPDNRNTDFPRIFDDYKGNQASGNSTRFLRDGDFVRLRNVQIGYNLPTEWVQKIGLDNLTLSVTGANLWTWVKDSKLKNDPEIRPDGFTNMTVPPIKSLTFNVNINF